MHSDAPLFKVEALSVAHTFAALLHVPHARDDVAPGQPQRSAAQARKVLVRRSRRAISEGATSSSAYQSLARRSSSAESGEPGMLRNDATIDSPSQRYMQRSCQKNASDANG